MKTTILKLLLILPLGILFSQKKEIKSAEKLLKSNQLDQAYEEIIKAEKLYKEAKLGSVKDKTVSNLYFIKASIESRKEETEKFIKTSQELVMYEEGMNFSAKNKSTGDKDYFLTEKELDNAISSESHKKPKKKKRKKINSDKLSGIIQPLTLKINEKAVKNYNENKFKEAGAQFEIVFKLMSANSKVVADTSLIYNAAICHSRAKDYESALKTYTWLIDNNYTGVKDVFTATDAKTGKPTTFRSKSEMDLYSKSGQYKDPKVEKTRNVLPGIYKETISLLMQLDKLGEGEKLALKAKEKFPTDNDLTLYIGDIYYKQGKKEEFIKILDEAIQKDPNNKVLYLNTAIVYQELKLNDKSEEAYLKAIKIDPKYTDAYFNYGVLILSEEAEINDEISNLGFSSKDRKKEKILVAKKQEMYKKAIVQLEKALELGKDSIDLISTMKGIYYQLEDTAKWKEMKAKEDALKK